MYQRVIGEVFVPFSMDNIQAGGCDPLVLEGFEKGGFVDYGPPGWY